MSAAVSPRVTGRMVAGGILIVLGALFTLDNFGVLDAGDIVQYWPVLLIAFGISKAMQSRHRDQKVAGVVIALVGGLLLVRSLHIVAFRLRELWPVFFVAVGALLVWESLRRRRAADPAERALAGAREGLASHRGGAVPLGAVLNEFAFMGGGDRVVRSQEFRGGDVTAIMGGFEIDLRGAAIAGDAAVINVFTLWGGVDLRVPEDWIVSMEGVPLLGVFSNTSRTAAGGTAPATSVAGKTLVVRGMSIMGGVEVKN